jgi:hypothetical protein
MCNETQELSTPTVTFTQQCIIAPKKHNVYHKYIQLSSITKNEIKFLKSGEIALRPLSPLTVCSFYYIQSCATITTIKC